MKSLLLGWAYKGHCDISVLNTFVGIAEFAGFLLVVCTIWYFLTPKDRR